MKYDTWPSLTCFSTLIFHHESWETPGDSPLLLPLGLWMWCRLSIPVCLIVFGSWVGLVGFSLYKLNIFFDSVNHHYLHNIYCIWILFMIYVFGSTFRCHSIDKVWVGCVGWVSKLALWRATFCTFSETGKMEICQHVSCQKATLMVFSSQISSSKQVGTSKEQTDPLAGPVPQDVFHFELSKGVKILWRFIHILFMYGPWVVCIHSAPFLIMQIHISTYKSVFYNLYTYIYYM